MYNIYIVSLNPIYREMIYKYSLHEINKIDVILKVTDI